MKPFVVRFPEWLGRFPDWVPLLGGSQIGGRPIFSYGTMLAIAFLAGWILAFYLSGRYRTNRRNTNTLFLYAAIGAIAGARLLYFIASDPQDFSLVKFFKVWEGGLVAYGGFIGGIVASAIAAVVIKADWWSAADATAPGIALGIGITRNGCFLYGCDFGKPVEHLFCYLRFPMWDMPPVSYWIEQGAPCFEQHVRQNLVNAAHDVLSLPVYPTQLMLSVNGIICFILLMLWLPFRKFRGQIMLLFLIYYAVTRFILEFFRGDRIRGVGVWGTPLSTSQIVSILVMLVAVALWVYFANSPKFTFSRRGKLQK